MLKKVLLLGSVAMLSLTFMTSTIFAQDSEGEEAWLGVAIAENESAVYINRIVQDSPADEADLARNDIITAIDDTMITSIEEVTALMDEARPGDIMTLNILRNDEALLVEVTLRTMPTEIVYERTNGDRNGRKNGWRGSHDSDIDMTHFTLEMLLRADLDPTEGGFEVVDIYNFRRGEDYGLIEGDVITTLNDYAVADIDLETFFTEIASMDEPYLHIVLVRDGEEVTLEVDTLYGNFHRSHPDLSEHDFNEDDTEFPETDADVIDDEVPSGEQA